MLKVLAALLTALAFCAPAATPGGELRFAVHIEPKTFHPALVEDEASELIRYMTGGVLLRVDRSTNRLLSELAVSSKVSPDGRQISFRLRPGVRFSDGTPFDAADVAFTLQTMMDPKLRSATADSFRSGKEPPKVEVLAPDSVRLTFAAPVAGLARLFDQVAILSSRSPLKEKAVLGPFTVAEYRAGAYVLLRRNPNYWKTDAKGQRLPYLDTVRIQIQSNRDLEALAFSRGELDLIPALDPVLFEQIQKRDPAAVQDLGATFDSEFFWFNQTAKSELPEYKKAWFRSQAFRNAISAAINRDDICRIVYRGHARPAVGPFPPTNTLWYNNSLPAHRHDPQLARRLLEKAGFRMEGGTLKDGSGNPVSFTLITNAGNRNREKIATLMQRDLRAIGVSMNIITLDFPSLLARMTRTFSYEACLLGLINVDEDPNGQMNVWLSSSANHQWNPGQTTPATEWEAEIDKAMRAQAGEPDARRRKALFDRVQQLAREQEPFIYVAHPNALAAASPRVKNLQRTSLRPRLLANIESLYLTQ